MRRVLKNAVKGNARSSLKALLRASNASTPQVEVARQKKRDFLSNCQNEFYSLFKQYLLKHGYFIGNTRTDIDKQESNSLDHIDIQESALLDDVVMPIKKIAHEFYTTLCLVKEGGRLTAKRRNILISSLHNLEELLSQMKFEHQLAVEYRKYRHEKASLRSVYIFSLAALCCALFWAPTFFYLFLVGLAWFVSQKKAISKQKDIVENTAIKIISPID